MILEYRMSEQFSGTRGHICIPWFPEHQRRRLRKRDKVKASEGILLRSALWASVTPCAPYIS